MARNGERKPTDPRYFLFIKHGKSKLSSANVICECSDRNRAVELRDLFRTQFGAPSNGAFAFQSGSTLTTAESVLIEETLERLRIYDDPDPGVYEPSPSQYDINRAAYMFRAEGWNAMLDRRVEQRKERESGESVREATEAEQIEAIFKELEERLAAGDIPKMEPEDARISGLNLLLLFSQAYYALLESATSTAAWCSAADPSLNHAYLWTIKNINALLANNVELKDFPASFEPIFDDLYPSTIVDCDWDEIVRPHAEQFLSQVQRYVLEKAIYDPVPGSPAAVMVQLFRHSIDDILKIAAAYSDRMQNHLKQVFGRTNTERKSDENTRARNPTVDNRTVFVVHGRNDSARQAMFDFLRALDLNPLEWGQVVRATGRTNPYIGEVLEKGFSIAQAIVVLFTPDDEARLCQQFWDSRDDPHETILTGQPRQNVLLEAGMALGRDPDRTIIVELGRLRPISDLGGRHVVRMDNSQKGRVELKNRLEIAKCAVNATGVDWLAAGNFVISAAKPVATSEKLRADVLSDDAKALLIAAAEDKHGSLTFTRSMYGLSVSTNGREFCENNNKRDEARWSATKEELLSSGTVEDYGKQPGTHFRLNRKGYDMVDEISREAKSQ
jgi:predicted nucleotide-binding protein